MESDDQNYSKNMTLLCGINTDDDVAGVLLTPSTDSTTEGSDDPAVFSVKLQSRPSSAVVVTSKLVGNDKTEVMPWVDITTITPDKWNEVYHFKVFLIQALCVLFEVVKIYNSCMKISGVH